MTEEEKTQTIPDRKVYCLETAIRIIPAGNRKDILELAQDIYDFIYKTKTDD